MDKPIEKGISTYLIKNKLATLSTCADGQPHSAICFYAFDPEKSMLLIKSSRETMHVQQGLKNPVLSGTILPNIYSIGTLKGIQFTACFQETDQANDKAIREHYHRKFPMAMAIGGEVWMLKLLTIKMTDNTLGFGKKLYWSSDLIK
jgi:uncharacterized protein YhbP (UPF0306 family)